VTTEERSRHWDSAYTARGATLLSWYQDAPIVSLQLIEALGVDTGVGVIDVGGGASHLATHLVERGFVDVSVLDISSAALAEARRRLRDAASVNWLLEDILDWRPERRFGLWHDRAVFHFLIAPDAQCKYLGTLRATVQDDGYVVLGTFAWDGPEFCSGLPVARYSTADLVSLLGAGFELVETRREKHVTPAGVVQPFTWVAGRMRPT
jgi:cyclopropane fatty-acyl-phospholipid synthase-like methyltransferase